MDRNWKDVRAEVVASDRLDEDRIAEQRRQVRENLPDRLSEKFSPRDELETVLGSVKAMPNETLDLDREIEEATTAKIVRLGRRTLS